LAQEQLDRTVTDPLTRALLPVLMHRMNNSTQLLSNLNTLAARSSEVDWFEERASDLAETSGIIDDTGYLLAVLACASGADLLLERRVSSGLSIAVRAVEQALKREGRTLSAEGQPLPRLSPSAGQGWELPWAFASLLLLSGRALERDRTLDWQLLEEGSSWVLVASASPADRFESIASSIADRLPESALDVRRGGWSWRIPSPWLMK
jgi:hypothetical protein